MDQSWCEEDVLARLRAGDETAFRALVRRHHMAMQRVARTYVATDAAAEEVVQETWMAVIRGLDGFEQRSTLKTWIFRILVNRARTKGVREHRTVPFSALAPTAEDQGEPAVSPDRFRGPDDVAPGYWISTPSRFFELPEERVCSAETATVIAQAIAALPERQQQVIRLRDVEGWGAAEVCEVLELSDGNQRILLHRARSHLRSVLERHFADALQPT